jgi:hypothetical protein
MREVIDHQGEHYYKDEEVTMLRARAAPHS